MKNKQVKIAEAKGRPMLHWVGKRPLTHVPAFPAQHVEAFEPEGAAGLTADVDWSDWPARYPKGGLLFHGDNKEVLAHLLANGFRGKVKLVYIDPPFDSGADYVRRVNLRGVKGTAKIEGETYSLGEQIQYTDIWANDNYLQFMYERLLLLRELLAEDGSIFVHTNQERTHLIRCVMDEVFGAEQFRNDIVWKRGPGKAHPEYFGRVKDTILFYTKSDRYTWNRQYGGISSKYERTFRNEDERGRYVTQPLHSGRPAKNVPEWRGARPPSGRGWAYKIETLDEFEAEGLIEWSDEGVPRLKRYLDDVEGAAIQDVWDDILDTVSSQTLQKFIDFAEAEEADNAVDLWDDIAPILDRSLAHSGYPTQKPVALAERIISACSNEADLVLDAFVGSGTVALAAQKLGRPWIGCDINKGAIQTTSKRLQGVIDDQIVELGGAQTELIAEAGADDAPAPAQLSFGVWRVNDYDLQVQHNEAVELVSEHLGVERTRSDSFFDGTLGRRLVKIVPFTHPLGPADLEEVKRELESRPDEDRDVAVVCLGKELKADDWLAEHNQLRRARGNPDPGLNRIDAIELRTDPKYGKFLAHEPAVAMVDVERDGDVARVRIDDFISPTIAERLEMDTPLFRAKIPDWRAMVDCVMIDPDYDGEVFRIALSDVPERKEDLVAGEYELPVSEGPVTVAVKVIDMLGEEVVVTKQV